MNQEHLLHLHQISADQTSYRHSTSQTPATPQLSPSTFDDPLPLEAEPLSIVPPFTDALTNLHQMSPEKPVTGRRSTTCSHQTTSPPPPHAVINTQPNPIFDVQNPKNPPSTRPSFTHPTTIKSTPHLPHITSHSEYTSKTQTQNSDFTPSTESEKTSQNPKPKKNPRQKDKSIIKIGRRPATRSTERHVTKPMSKEEGSYIDVDTYVPTAERSTKKKKRRFDLGKEKVGTTSTHAETKKTSEVQPTLPTVQQSDYESMADLWHEVPIFSISAPNQIVQQDFRPDEWNLETPNIQSLVRNENFDSMVLHGEESIGLLEWPYDIAQPQAPHTLEGTTTVFTNDTIIPSTTVVTELPPECKNGSTVYNTMYTTIFSQEHQTPQDGIVDTNTQVDDMNINTNPTSKRDDMFIPNPPFQLPLNFPNLSEPNFNFITPDLNTRPTPTFTHTSHQLPTPLLEGGDENNSFFEGGTVETTNSSLGPIAKQGKKAVDDEDIAWEPSDEVPLTTRKSKRKKAQKESVAKKGKKQKEVVTGRKGRPKANRFSKLPGLSERGFDTNCLNRFEFIKKVIIERGWEKYVAIPQPYRLTWVQEFYDAVAITDGKTVLVRGMNVSFSSANINDYFGLTEPEVCEYTRLLGNHTEDDLNLILETLGKEGATWTPKGRTKVLLTNKLVKDASIWIHFIRHSLHPTTHDYSISVDRMILLYCILTGKTINVGDVVSKAIQNCATKPTGKLYFPCLINGLMKKAKVPITSGDKLIKELNVIEHKTVERIRKEPKVTESHPDSEETQTWRSEIEKGLKKASEKVEILSKEIDDQSRKLREELKLQKEAILKEIRGGFVGTAGLSESAHEAEILREENARLKREVEELKAWRFTGQRSKRGSTTPTPRE